MASGCCGHPTRRKPSAAAQTLPANPRITDGVRLFYIGTGVTQLSGTTALRYTVADHRRRFVATAEDARVLIRRRDVMLAP
jgi:hypothetical protein